MRFIPNIENRSCSGREVPSSFNSSTFSTYSFELEIKHIMNTRWIKCPTHRTIQVYKYTTVHVPCYFMAD